MDAAALRPSAIAHTTSDWPRRMSPAAKTPWHRSHVVLVRGHVAARVQRHAQLLDQPVLHRAVNPIASSTRSASSVNSVPAIGSKRGGGPTRTACNVLHVALLVARELHVLMPQSRVPPSSCELSVRSCSGHSGQGVAAARSSGGFGMISNW